MITEALSAWLEAGGGIIGQVLAGRDFSLRHADDAGRGDLEVFSDPEAARRIALWDDAGVYRPLKTAPNLRRGWCLQLQDARAVRLALDYLYPAALGLASAAARGLLAGESLREVLGRQTGMYAVAKKITDEDAAEAVARVCGGCLRERLWTVADSLRPDPGPWDPRPRCIAACQLLVAEARRVVKSRAQTAGR